MTGNPCPHCGRGMVPLGPYPLACASLKCAHERIVALSQKLSRVRSWVRSSGLSMPGLEEVLDDAPTQPRLGSPRVPSEHWEITEVEIDKVGGSGAAGDVRYVVIGWASKNHGFGQLTIVQKPPPLAGGPSTLEVQTETLGKAFAKKVLGALVDKAKKTE